MRSREHRRQAARRASLATGVGRVPTALLDEISVAVLALRGDELSYANAAAHRLGVVRGAFLVVPEIRKLARLVRRDGVRRELDLSLPAPDLGLGRVPVHAELFLLGGDEVGVVVADQTEVARVEAVRRDFVANVSHEVKTPVGAISVLAEAVREARDDPVAVAHFADRIAAETARLSRLVQELLDLSRVQGGEPLPELRAVPVDRVVADAIERLQPAADSKGVRVELHTDGGHVVLGDPAQLTLAVVNLTDNAIAYSDPDTTVTVSVHAREDVVEVAVVDQGVGIPPEDLDRIFERFYRVDPARSRATGGTGLGLAIVKHVLHNHGGEVTVSSRLGHGSTFTLRLPMAAEVEPA
ncbi:MAG TPA: ATP-binding protein [Mycobacteriales bacterium]|nr:ATP-binding protein [Mycobacteriales bacterium]